MRFIDVHCHLTGYEYGDFALLLSRLEEAGVKKVITAGFDLKSSEDGARLADKYPAVYFTAGFHPNDLKKYRDGDLNAIADLLKHPKCVAVGEIGLDYHYEDTTDKPLQHELFVRQLSLAHSAGLPVQIHSRDCAEDMFVTLSDHKDLLSCGALLHCYSHSPELAQRFSLLGLSFSFGGTITYKGSKRARNSILALPAEKLLTETDSPYLPPESRRGEFPNTPESIPEIASVLAALKEVPLSEFSETVWKNAHSLFPRLGAQ